MVDNPNGWPDKPGVPLNPDRSGWHWLLPTPRVSPRFPMAMEWVASWQEWKVGNAPISPDRIAANGWMYEAPCLTHAEVEERIAIAETNALHGAEVAAREAAAYQRAAEAMREAAALSLNERAKVLRRRVAAIQGVPECEAYSATANVLDGEASVIRNLPIPEDKP